VRQAARPHPGDRHGQAHLARRIARTRGGHGAGHRIHVPRGGSLTRLASRGDTSRLQGFGNVGSWAARIFCQLGCKLVGASDVDGAIQSPTGIDPEALLAHIRQGGKLPEYSGSGVEAITAQQLMQLDCEVLVPAALGGTIHAENADSIRARLIIEGANSPTTPTADEILNDRGTFVVATCSPTPAASSSPTRVGAES